ncbi:hypothetical protein LCGC14_2891840 [marine sediment metagenome]|uniref:Uncharacterized protein n=1 Tax=marine sediment metagenome TaxID=412755 RepID=A0A0F8XXB8_9ZZZZ
MPRRRVGQRRSRKKQTETQQQRVIDDGGMGFVPDNTTDFYPDGVEDPATIEQNYKDGAEKSWKKLENQLLKVLLI